jgi:hypothetical protein
MKIKCAYKEILDIDDPKIIPNPDNPNDHPDHQITQLSKILEYQGQRKSIVISKQSGFIVTGHGTLMAAKELGAKKIAVDFQDFDNPAQEYAHVIADNAVALQSELNRSMINEKLPDFGPELDVETMLGFKHFTVEPLDNILENNSKELSEADFDNFKHECPKCGFEWNDHGTT